MKSKKIGSGLCGAAVRFSSTGFIPVTIEDVTYPVTFGGTVTDAGQYVTSMTVDYGADKDTVYPFFPANTVIPVVKTATSGSKVIVYFQQDVAPSLTYLMSEAVIHPQNWSLL